MERCYCACVFKLSYRYLPCLWQLDGEQIMVYKHSASVDASTVFNPPHKSTSAYDKKMHNFSFGVQGKVLSYDAYIILSDFMLYM